MACLVYGRHNSKGGEDCEMGRWRKVRVCAGNDI